MNLKDRIADIEKRLSDVEQSIEDLCYDDDESPNLDHSKATELAEENKKLRIDLGAALGVIKSRDSVINALQSKVEEVTAGNHRTAVAFNAAEARVKELEDHIQKLTGLGCVKGGILESAGKLAEETEELRRKARLWYTADGTAVELASEEVVVAKRKDIARAFANAQQALNDIWSLAYPDAPGVDASDADRVRQVVSVFRQFKNAQQVWIDHVQDAQDLNKKLREENRVLEAQLERAYCEVARLHQAWCDDIQIVGKQHHGEDWFRESVHTGKKYVESVWGPEATRGLAGEGRGDASA